MSDQFSVADGMRQVWRSLLDCKCSMCPKEHTDFLEQRSSVQLLFWKEGKRTTLGPALLLLAPVGGWPGKLTARILRHLFYETSSDLWPLVTFFLLLLTLVYCHRAHHTSATGSWWHLQINLSNVMHRTTTRDLSLHIWVDLFCFSKVALKVSFLSRWILS